MYFENSLNSYDEVQEKYRMGEAINFANKNAYRSEINRKTAKADIIGGPLAPEIRGTVTFTDVPGGTEVRVEVNGLPKYKPADGKNPPIGPHGFHIHENGSCLIGDPDNPFQAAGEHWNPTNQPMAIMPVISLYFFQTMDMQGCASLQINLKYPIS